MGAACRYILLIFSVWVWSVSPRPSTGQTLKKNWYSPRQADTTECGFVNNEPVACCNSSDYGMCIAYLNPDVNDGKCSPVPRTKTTKTKSPIEEFRKSKKKQNKNKVNGTRNKRQHENKIGKSSKQKVKTRIKLMKILKEKKVEEMSSEKDKRMRKEDKQLPPKICPGPCVCNFEFMVKMKKLKTKHRVAVRKLYRIQAWWNLLKFGKQYKAKGDATIVPKKEPTFSIPFGFLSSATNGATTCGCSSLSSHPNNNNITSIYNQLKNCTRTATWACSTEDITLTKDMWKNNCTNCSSSVCVQSDTNCAANKSYITSCKPLWQNFTLTQEMVTHIEDVCLPQLNAWISRYRSCGSCKTYGDCVYSCQSDANLYNCQSRSCDIDKLCGVNNNCIFETCLKNGINPLNCKCDCYKKLENLGKAAQFPIDQETIVGGMNCYQMNAFERLVYTRRNRCLNPGGITEDNNDGLGVDLQDYTGGPFPLVPGLKTSAPSVKDRLSGNFVDCRFQGRQAFEWIYECSKPCCTSASSSTIPSATSFSPSTSSSSTATTTVTISTKTITSTTTAIYASTTTSKTNTASRASTTKTSTTSSTSTTTATISSTTSTKTSTTTPTTTTTTTSTATISTTTSITTSTTTSTTTPTTTTTTTSTTTPTTTTTTTTSTTTTTTTTT